MPTNSIEDLRIFQRVATLSSFTQAADHLALPKAKVSQSIARLENGLRTQLFHRTTRTVKLTHDGQALFDRLKDVLSDIDEIETMFLNGDKDVRGRLRIDLPLSMGTKLVIPRLPEFFRSYPHIEIEISTTDRQVDVIREGFDCVVRVGQSLNPELIARRVGQLSITNVASIGYIRKHGTPKTLEDLDRHRIVAYAPNFDPEAEGFEYVEGGQRKMRRMPCSLTVNSSEAYLQAALAGLGIIQAPSIGVKDGLSKGLLVEVMKDFPAEPMPVTILFPHRRNLARRSRLFMNWMEQILGDYLE